MPRPAYDALPATVRGFVQEVLGAPVQHAETQPGGWSPGVAARVRCADGTRAFVKAVSSEVDAFTPLLHRREAEVVAALPDAAGAPRLLGTYDDGAGVALVLEDVEGVEPALPADLPAVLRALDRLADAAAPPGLAPAREQLLGDFGGWARLAEAGAEPPARQQRHLDALVDLEAAWPQACAGDGLLHLDVRTDNLLRRPDGEAVLVDWPWAAAGDPVLDVVAFLPSAVLQGAGDPDELLHRTAAGRRADPDAVTCLVAAVAGRMEEHARRPPPPALPRVRAFQAAQGAAAGAWLRRRTGWSSR